MQHLFSFFFVLCKTTLKSESFDNATSSGRAGAIDCAQHYLLRHFLKDFDFQFVAAKFAALDDTMGTQ